MRRKRRILDTESGVPGVGEFWACDACGSLISPDQWDEEGAPCPACGSFGTPDTVLDRIARICKECVREQWGCPATDLAEMILDEIPEEE